MSPRFAVPECIDGLVNRARLNAELGGGGLQILDGPEVQWPQNDFLAVGLGPEDLSMLSSRTAAGPESQTDRGDVICLIRSYSGDPAPKTRRDRVYGLLAALQADIDADPTLGGHVDHAEVTGHTWVPTPTTNGIVADLVVTVAARIF